MISAKDFLCFVDARDQIYEHLWYSSPERFRPANSFRSQERSIVQLSVRAYAHG